MYRLQVVLINNNYFTFPLILIKGNGLNIHERRLHQPQGHPSLPLLFKSLICPLRDRYILVIVSLFLP